eukprot:5199174-Amphidinium_carterae.1
MSRVATQSLSRVVESTAGDRHHRHLKQGTPICEHEGCGQNDTPSHRLCTCAGRLCLPPVWQL